MKLITSDEDIKFSDSFNLAANKKYERCLKNQNRKEKWLKPVSLHDIAMM